MKEKLLQYIWQFQYFSRNELTTVNHKVLQIIHPGLLNANQGPDFLDAKIKLNNILWAGNIELHIKTSDWNLHNHTSDNNYNNIVLHVVWIHDAEIKDTSGNSLATLELQSRVSKVLLSKYEDLLNAFHFIPCENQVPQLLAQHLNELTLLSWKQRLLAERMEKRSSLIFHFLHQNNFNWEETFWWMIARNFGLKVNSDAFENIARCIPLNVLAKHKTQIHQLEALLFGQGGLLEKEFTEDYPLLLQKEYRFFQKKYSMQPASLNLFFLRMRPANFPTIRLAQLAMLISKSEHLFSKVREELSLVEIKKLLDVTANDYWHYHYIFDDTSDYKPKNTGTQMINNIIINTIIPLLFAYGLYHKEQSYKDKAINWLFEIAAEKNAVTKGFELLHFSNKSAFDSQSYIQLKNEYCNTKRCLECAIGNALIKRSAVQ